MSPLEIKLLIDDEVEISGLAEGNLYSDGDCTLQGNALVTFVVISIPRACSNYFCIFTFRMFVSEFLLSNAYNHSKQTLIFMQTTTTNKNCKEKETCIYLKGGVWPSSLYKKKAMRKQSR